MIELNEKEVQFLRALWSLRYLSGNQIWRVWYRDRSEDACDRRLRRLRDKKLIERVSIGHPFFPSAWTVTSEGIRALRGLCLGEFFSFRPVTRMFLPHLLQTNEVFVRMCGDGWIWDELLFQWVGSHKSSYAYTETEEKREARLTPDAVVTFKNSPMRIFLELDRSTERIRKRDRHRTIEGKLKAYQQFFTQRPMDGLRTHPTWYQQVFPDAYPACVLFVLGREAVTEVQRKNRERRMRQIVEISERLFSDLRVRCMALDEIRCLEDLLLVTSQAMDAFQIHHTKAMPYDIFRELLECVHQIYPTISDVELRKRVKASANASRELLLQMLRQEEG